MVFIILTEEFEHRVGVNNIIQSVRVNEKGNPLLRSDLISKIQDEVIRVQMEAVTSNEDIQPLPEIGQPVTEGALYVSEFGLIKCRQSHNMTAYEISDIPALFSFYRGEEEDEWIQNEYVYLGWIRIYNEVKYKVIQEHQTQSDWTPDNTPTLWEVYSETSDESTIEVWVQPTGAQDAYNIGDQIYFPTEEDNIYESLIDANVWSPTGYPAGWKEVEL